MELQTYHITIPGMLVTKKNGQVLSMFYWNQGKKVLRKSPVLIPKKEYVSWCKIAVEKLTLFKQKHPDVFPIGYPINLKVISYIKSGVGRLDLSATYEGIQDVLQGQVPLEIKNSLNPTYYQMILEDSFQYICGHDGSRIFMDAVNPRMEVFLEPYRY